MESVSAPSGLVSRESAWSMRKELRGLGCGLCAVVVVCDFDLRSRGLAVVTAWLTLLFIVVVTGDVFFTMGKCGSIKLGLFLKQKQNRNSNH